MKVITTTAAGRKRYMEVLVHYLLKNKQYINRHKWLLNTNNKDDIAYIESITASDPDFFEIIRVPLPPPPKDKNFASAEIHRFYPLLAEDDTLYIRLDDDIAFIADDAIPNLIKFRTEHRSPFLIFGNIVNNVLCSHIHQRMGALPSEAGPFTYNCTCPYGWEKSEGAKVCHDFFFKHLQNNNLDVFKFSSWKLYLYERFSINVMSYSGSDMRSILPVEWDEEQSLTRITEKIGRPNLICGSALFSHLSFYTQKDVIDPIYLPKYRALAGL